MAAHLDLFHTIYSGVEHHLDRLHQDFEQIRKNGKSIRSTEAMKADASLVKKGFFIAAAHANCAETLVTETVLSNFPTVHCLRRRISPSKEVKECKGLLTKGSF